MKRGTLEIGLLAVASLLPAVGVGVFGWSATEISAVYVVEALTVACSYAVVGLFARRPSAVDERERTEIPLLPLPELSFVPEQFDVPGLPPIRAENVHIAGVSVAFVSVVVVTVGGVASGSLVDDPTRPVLNQVDIVGFVTEIVGAFGAVTATVAGVIALAQLTVVSRWYAAPSRRQTLSAYAAMQRLNRVVVGCIVAVVVCYAVGSGVAAAAPVDATTAIVVAFCLSKLGLEWRRVRGESGAEDGAGAWLVPADTA